ncbi:MAG: glucosaminidase domain-containing protein [Cyclobacteriaceae bacterium]
MDYFKADFIFLVLQKFKQLIIDYRKLLIIIISILSIILLVQFLLKFTFTKKPEIVYLYAENIDEIIPFRDSLVSPVVYLSVPDLRKVDMEQRKMSFIELLLPSILIVREEAHETSNRLQLLLDKTLLSQALSADDSLFLAKVQADIQEDNLEILLDKVKTHPPSLVLAQAIIESGWGTSRFFREANNTFGIWSFSASEDRISASMTRAGRSIFLRKYPDVYSSIVDYYNTLARSAAYKNFRKKRLETEDPLVLAGYLQNYSEKRGEYVQMLRNIIRQNDLTQYDTYLIDWTYIPDTPDTDQATLPMVIDSLILRAD